MAWRFHSIPSDDCSLVFPDMLSCVGIKADPGLLSLNLQKDWVRLYVPYPFIYDPIGVVILVKYKDMIYRVAPAVFANAVMLAGNTPYPADVSKRSTWIPAHRFFFPTKTHNFDEAFYVLGVFFRNPGPLALVPTISPLPSPCQVVLHTDDQFVYPYSLNPLIVCPRMTRPLVTILEPTKQTDRGFWLWIASYLPFTGIKESVRRMTIIFSISRILTTILIYNTIHVSKCHPVSVISEPSTEGCYKEMRVIHESKIKYIIPRSRVLTEYGSKIPCNDVFGNIFKIQNKWICMGKSVIETKSPDLMEIKDKSTFNFSPISDLYKYGPYSVTMVKDALNYISQHANVKQTISQMVDAFRGV